MCQEVVSYHLSGSATAQNLLWFGAPSLAHFPSLGRKLATILTPSWVCRDLEKLIFCL